MKKQELLKKLINKKKDLEIYLDELNKKNDYCKKEYENKNSLIKTSNEYKHCVNSFLKKELSKTDKLIRNVITLISVLLVIIINILTNIVFDFIKFPINSNFITFTTIIESLIITDIFIFKPNYEYKIEIKSNEVMKKYILTEEKEKQLKSEIDLIMKNKELIAEKIKKTKEEIVSLDESIKTLLIELFNEEKIKNLILQDLINTNKNYDKQINLIIDDFDKQMVRRKNLS